MLPKVLFIDDYEDLVQSFMLFYKKSFDIAYAGSLQGAYEELQNGNFDLIVVDYYLPDGFGVELSGAITEIPIILLSGDPTKIEKYGGLFSAAFSKPVELHALGDAMLQLTIKPIE